ncbi:MAG: iron-containing alcohol dehydrogenase [Deltaproteobacteria bacterium]|nr:iron-containing alcohol dehydrogenase [Deltaproteobacteria bacterium]
MGAVFEFATATRIVFGAGKAALVPALVKECGASKVLIVTGKRTERAQPLALALAGLGVEHAVFPIDGEPTVDHVRRGVLVGRGCDAVVGWGGGSALDGGKAIAALLGNGGDPLDYLEVVGRGQTLSRPSLPFVAVPTTAGTGSEVTRNAVLGVPQSQVKASLRSPFMLPSVAVVDPDLLIGLPTEVLRSSALDALAQNIEPFLSSAANPLTDALCQQGIERSARSVRRAVLDGPDGAARDDLALASLYGGLALANAGLGAVHGFAAPLGGMFNAPHGAVCAALLAATLDVNHRALQSRAPTHAALPRFEKLGLWLAGAPDAGAAVAWVISLCRDLGVPGLATYGVRPADVPQVVAKAKSASSMKKNPLVLTDEELTEILTRSL